MRRLSAMSLPDPWVIPPPFSAKCHGSGWLAALVARVRQPLRGHRRHTAAPPAVVRQGPPCMWSARAARRVAPRPYADWLAAGVGKAGRDTSGHACAGGRGRGPTRRGFASKSAYMGLGPTRPRPLRCMQGPCPGLLDATSHARVMSRLIA